MPPLTTAEILAQLSGQAPPPAYVPFDTSRFGINAPPQPPVTPVTGSGVMPVTGDRSSMTPGVLPASTGVTPAVPATPAYATATRPALPAPVAENPQFAPQQAIWSPPAAPSAPPESLDAVMARLKGQPPPGMGPGLSPGWVGQGTTPGYGALNTGPTEAEKALLRQHPAYGRTIQRLRSLDQQRAMRGMI